MRQSPKRIFSVLYLLDSNTLITAKNLYYKFNRVPEFWEWLLYQGEQGVIKVPSEIYDEISDPGTPKNKKDNLAIWAESADFKEHLLFVEESDQILVTKIIYGGYTNKPTEDDLKKMGHDPFLLSYALQDLESRIIVSDEVSNKAVGANRKIPDVAKDFDIKCINTFQLLDHLNFSTSWK